MITLKDFYYLRHGETDWNLEYRGMGQKDIALNERGKQQATNAARLLAHEPIKLICHSPLQRARNTALIIANVLNIPMVEIPELIECSFGEKEGQIKGTWLDKWIVGAAIPGAEIYEDFLLRAISGINKALSKEGPVLIVSHGGVFWSIQKYAQLSTKYDLENCLPLLLRAPPTPQLPWGVISIYSEMETY